MKMSLYVLIYYVRRAFQLCHISMTFKKAVLCAWSKAVINAWNKHTIERDLHKQKDLFSFTHINKRISKSAFKFRLICIFGK